ncbi:S-layer homology domain-containing protein [Papillibacter cinnamivorans]|uniref:S-layer homology domain-containing protein n=1 Tax=Papillibacter cinnamivorans DSM 12816 TaxID=1122930 RepID=A0A1W2C6Q3_9FIRM|nr:S-layer homology domain-containing protein [Papillibacter cinnamivorans]SMC80786.1 S-layer homology domain-containing protein [Papillibacter cinnamivorans DSM 12816]
MKQKFLALVLAAAVTASLFVLPASAAYVSETTAKQVLGALDIMNGDASGDYKLGNTLTRAELAKLLVQASTKRNTVSGSSKFSLYSDVPYTHWAAGYIQEAVSLGCMSAYPNGTFQPSRQVLLEEATSAILRLMGYSSADYGTGYPDAQVNFAKSLGLYENVSASVGSVITRGTALYLFYNALCATAKNGSAYIKTLGYSISGDGLDVEDIVTSNSEGPLIVTSDTWYSGTGLSTTGLSLYKNGASISLSDVELYDVVYYSPSLNAAWVYDSKVTGVFQSALPSRISPASVVVSGTTYSIESVSASEALSYTGGLSYGDTVTLLLGRDGGVAGVISSSGTATVYGYVTAAGSKTYTNTGSTVYSHYISILTAGGTSLEYQVALDASDSVGSVACIRFSDGAAYVGGVTPSTLSGKVSISSKTIAGLEVSPSVSILDVDTEGNAVTTYLQRLDGVTLSSGDVLLYLTDSDGRISDLILNQVTGDTKSYGILTAVSESTSNITASGSYSYLIGSSSGRVSTSGIAFGLGSTGPAAFIFSGNSVAKISLLSELGSVALTGSNSVTASDGTKYLLSDTVSAYYVSAGSYTPLTLEQAKSYSTLTAFYDKAESLGGRVRVLLAY